MKRKKPPVNPIHKFLIPLRLCRTFNFVPKGRPSQKVDLDPPILFVQPPRPAKNKTQNTNILVFSYLPQNLVEKSSIQNPETNLPTYQQSNIPTNQHSNSPIPPAGAATFVGNSDFEIPLELRANAVGGFEISALARFLAIGNEVLDGSDFFGGL